MLAGEERRQSTTYTRWTAQQRQLFALHRAATLDDRPAKPSPTDWWLLGAAIVRFALTQSLLGHILWAVLFGELALALVILGRVSTLSPAARFVLHHAWLPTFLVFENILAQAPQWHILWSAILLFWIVQLVRHRRTFWRSDVELGDEGLQVSLGMAHRSLDYSDIASVEPFTPKRGARLFNPAVKQFTVLLRLKPTRLLGFLPGPRRLRLALPPEDADAFIDAVRARLAADT